MKISDIGGEFALIKRLTDRACQDPAVVRGVGDDCAVLEYTPERYLLVTTDMMVENDHFSLKWHSPFQIGWKLMESNVSDIIAMGGSPHWAFLSLALTQATEVEFMDELYRGIHASADRHGVAILGGDITHGRDHVVNATLIGDVEKNRVCLRSGAMPGDLICATGDLGKSQAGLKLLLQGEWSRHVKGHLEPRCRTEAEGRAIARHATAMIDASDGLASEVRHLCEESGTGGRIRKACIPLAPDTVAGAALAGGDPCEYALYGGEDFELVFTLPPGRLGALRSEFTDFTVVGEMVPSEGGLFLVDEGRLEALRKGYDHFAV